MWQPPYVDAVTLSTIHKSSTLQPYSHNIVDMFPFLLFFTHHTPFATGVWYMYVCMYMFICACLYKLNIFVFMWVCDSQLSQFSQCKRSEAVLIFFVFLFSFFYFVLRWAAKQLMERVAWRILVIRDIAENTWEAILYHFTC